MKRIPPRPKRPGWQDATTGPAVEPTPGPSDAILYDAQGRRIGVMDRVTRERKLDRTR